MQAEMEPGRQVHLGGPRRKSFDFDRGGRHHLRRSKFRVTQEQKWAVVSPTDRRTLLRNPSGKILSVLRLNVMFRKDTTSPKRQQLFKASGRKVVKKAVQTPQKESTTNPSIPSSTSIQDSPLWSCWQRPSITFRRLSTTLIRNAHQRSPSLSPPSPALSTASSSWAQWKNCSWMRSCTRTTTC